MDNAQHTERSIGLWGAVMTLVGLVIGASIFILPGQLAGIAGPSVIVAYLVGGLMAFFTCLIAAQIGCIISRSGGSFHAITDIISPTVGFLVMWATILAVVLACALVSLGFADYLQVYFPGVAKLPAALGLVVIFCVINIAGARASVFSQTAMTAIFLVVTAVFIVAGLHSMNTDNLVPLLPLGLPGLTAIIVPAYFSWTGVTMLMEIGGEIKNPTKNIPLSVFIAFAIILVFYIGVCVALVGTIPWEDLGQHSAPVAAAAELLLPGWMVSAITLSAVLAAATSLISLLLADPRDLYAMSKQGLLPAFLGQLRGPHAVPANAVLVMALITVAALFTGGKIIDFASIAVIAFMLLQIILAVALVRLPMKMPEEYQNASFRLPIPLIWFCAAFVALSSLAFLIKSVMDDPGKSLFFVVFMLVGWIYYLLRLRYLNNTATAEEAS